MKKRSVPILTALLFFLALPGTYGQIFRDYYMENIPAGGEPNAFELHVNAATFFNNNEFFGTNIEGYTLTGAFFQPLLKYNITGDLSLGAGIHLLKYNGRDDFAQTLPLFRIDYKASDHFTLTMGSFNGGESFRLAEPLYQFENHFTDLVNNGIRLDYHRSRIRSLTWINWEHFILPGDTLQEQFTAGSSNSFSLFENDKFHFEIPVQFLVHHQGGQINITDKPVISTLNMGAGLNIIHSFRPEKHGKIYFNPMFFYASNDEEPEKGLAWYPLAGLRLDPFSLTAGYFHGSDFKSIHGEPLFFSPGISEKGLSGKGERSLITFKAGYGKKIARTSAIMLRFEGYYDTVLKKLQYTYGLHVVVGVGGGR